MVEADGQTCGGDIVYSSGVPWYRRTAAGALWRSRSGQLGFLRGQMELRKGRFERVSGSYLSLDLARRFRSRSMVKRSSRSSLPVSRACSAMVRRCDDRTDVQSS